MAEQNTFAQLTHPGVLLLKDYLKPLKISQNKLARAMQVPPGRINEIINGKRAISADTSLRLGKALGMSDRFWFNMQTDYDFRKAQQRSSELKEIQPLVKLSA